MADTDTQAGAEGVATGTGATGGDDSTTDNTQTADTGAEGTESTSGAGTVSLAEFEQLKRRMIAADRRATTAENAVKKAQDAEKSELQLAKDEAEKARQDAAALKTDIHNTKLLNAFLSDSTNSWHDASDAFTLLQSSFMDGVEVDDQGKVIGMDTAIKALAKKKPHLIKAATSTSEATGSAHSSNRKGEEQQADRKALQARFPAAFN